MAQLSVSKAWDDTREIFARDGSLIPPDVPPDGRFDRPGSGLYANIELPNGNWMSDSSRGMR